MNKFSEVSWNNWLEYINDNIYHYGIQLSGSPEALVVQFDPEDYKVGKPTVTFTSELDSDGESEYITFLPKITLPSFDAAEMQYYDSMEYFLEIYAKNLGGFTKVMFQTPYEKEQYTYDEYDDYVGSSTTTELEYIDNLKKSWEAGEISDEAYDSGMMNIGAFVDDEEDY